MRRRYLTTAIVMFMLGAAALLLVAVGSAFSYWSLDYEEHGHPAQLPLGNYPQQAVAQPLAGKASLLIVASVLLEQGCYYLLVPPLVGVFFVFTFDSISGRVHQKESG
jgi:hypothetical protein